MSIRTTLIPHKAKSIPLKWQLYVTVQELNILMKQTIMRIITTKVHAAMDYLIGALLIAAPWIFDFSRDGAETWVPVVLGVGALLYNLLTRYEYSIFKSISMKTHLNLDMASGVFLAVSPWVFGFSDFIYLPHLILGTVEISSSLVTERQPRFSVNENPPFEHAAGTNLP